MWRLLISIAAIVALDNGTASAQENAFHEVDTKYIFGSFTVGSSIGEQGEKAFEPETKAAFGKRSGRYIAAETIPEYEFTPTRYLQIELGPIISYYNIRNVPGLENRNLAAVNGFEANFRPVIIDRGASGLAVTGSIEPEFHSRDETSGAKVVNYSLETRFEADIELIKNRLFFGSNLLYEPETTRADFGVWQRESTWGISAALAYQIVPKVVIGADLWYLQHYEGLAFNTFTGDALYLGPTLYWQIAPKVLVSAAFEMQIAGREVGAKPANLDLTDFSRTRARLLFEFEF
jgi:hypothetical protein